MYRFIASLIFFSGSFSKIKLLNNRFQRLSPINLTETTFLIGKDGIRIADLDTNQIILVKMNLLSGEFEEYEVNEEIEIGVEMMTLHKIVKHITNNDSLILSMDDSTL